MDEGFSFSFLGESSGDFRSDKRALSAEAETFPTSRESWRDCKVKSNGRRVN